MMSEQRRLWPIFLQEPVIRGCVHRSCQLGLVVQDTVGRVLAREFRREESAAE